MKVFVLANYGPQAIKGIIQGSDREAALNAMAASVGGSLVSLSFTRGVYDILATFDVPNQDAILALSMAARASGSLTELVILEAVDVKPIADLAQKVAYKPAG